MTKDYINSPKRFPAGGVCKICGFGKGRTWTPEDISEMKLAYGFTVDKPHTRNIATRNGETLAITGQGRPTIIQTCFRYSDICGGLLCREHVPLKDATDPYTVRECALSTVQESGGDATKRRPGTTAGNTGV